MQCLEMCMYRVYVFKEKHKYSDYWKRLLGGKLLMRQNLVVKDNFRRNEEPLLLAIHHPVEDIAKLRLSLV